MPAHSVIMTDERPSGGWRPVTALTTSIMKSGVSSPSRLMANDAAASLNRTGRTRAHSGAYHCADGTGPSGGAQQQRTRAQRAGFLGRRLPHAALDDIEHRPVVGAARDDDMHAPVSGQKRHGKRQLVEWTGREVDRLALEAEPHGRGQEGSFVEARRGNGDEATDIGLAHGPAQLLGDVEQGPHQGIDAGTARFVHTDCWKLAVLEGSHTSRVPETPLDSMI